MTAQILADGAAQGAGAPAVDDADFGDAAQGSLVQQGFHLIQGLVHPLAPQVQVRLDLAGRRTAVVDAGVPVVAKPNPGDVGVYAGGWRNTAVACVRDRG